MTPETCSEEDALAWLQHCEAQLPEAARPIPFAPLWWPRVVGESGPPLTEAAPTMSPGVLRGLQTALLARLAEVSAATLAEVMTADLTVGQRFLRGALPPPADPPRVEFARFCRRMATGGIEQVYLDYPVLRSLVDTAVRQWRESGRELVVRVARHRQQLAEVFGIEVSAPLTGVAMTAGDRHNDGRSVAILAFGTSRLVYKPRDVHPELLWSRAVGAVFDGRLRAASTLTADDGAPYGFTEFIEAAPAADPAELAAFYGNAGRTLALLHALSATDCHHENLIAARDQLVLVDAEALFETRGSGLLSGAPRGHRPPASVMDVGMLPQWVWLAGKRTAIDISALGAAPEVMRVAQQRGWRAINTDAMSRGPIDVDPAQPPSLPVRSEDPTHLGAHADALVAGFEDGYRSLMAARTQLLALLGDARGMTRRLILRPTRVYALLQLGTWEPAALRSQDDWDRVVAQLDRAYEGAPPRLAAVLDAEREAIARLDVPLFEAAVTGNLTTWFDGDVPDWPGVDALAEVRGRIAGLDEADLRWQVRLIRSAVMARAVAADAQDRSPATGGFGDDAGAGDVPAMLGRVRGRIVADAISLGDHVTWMTMAVLPDGDHVQVQQIGAGLYDGLLGVAVALSECGEVGVARSAVGPLCDELTAGDPALVRRQLLAVGVGWNGVGGYLRALPWLVRRGLLAQDLADRCVGALIDSLSPEVVARDQGLDVMGGVAGLIVPLADLLSSAEASDGRIEALLANAADRLVEAQRPDGGWDTLPSSAPLTGYAHGASGIAVALASAHAALGDERHLDAALRGVAYEASTFDRAADNWPDFRADSRGGFMLGWCAGAPGIALARMRLMDLLPDHPSAPDWSRELHIAAHTTATAPLLHRDHLCCGNLGRAAILRALGQRFGQGDWTAAGERLVDLVAANGGLPRSFLGATPAGVLSIPGLMTGLSGSAMVLVDHLSELENGWVTALLL